MRARTHVPGMFSLPAEQGVLASVRSGPCIDTINGFIAAGPRNVAAS
jgi:hypothetical protein